MPILRRLLGLFARPAPRVVVLKEAPTLQLSPQAREEFRRWLSDPLTRRALATVEMYRPSPLKALVNGPEGRDTAMRVICRMQGWDTFRDLLLTLPDWQDLPEAPEETYQAQLEKE